MHWLCPTIYCWQTAVDRKQLKRHQPLRPPNQRHLTAMLNLKVVMFAKRNTKKGIFKNWKYFNSIIEIILFSFFFLKKRHHFYDCLCPECADLNWFKRNRIVDLKDRVILVTGGRVKIGFEAGFWEICEKFWIFLLLTSVFFSLYFQAVKLLRCGATVHVTTRFPNNAAKRFFFCLSFRQNFSIFSLRRYAELKDFKDFSSRLHIHGLDLRDLGAVERFAAWFCEQVLKI